MPSPLRDLTSYRLFSLSLALIFILIAIRLLGFTQLTNLLAVDAMARFPLSRETPSQVWLLRENESTPLTLREWQILARRLSSVHASAVVVLPAFNDPPADFDIEEPFLVLELDAACRQQQLGEGWFKSLEDVPRHAISMSIRQIMKAQALLVTVPDTRKARALRDSLEGPVTHRVPSSILQQHPACYVYTDEAGAGLLSRSYPLRRL